MRVGIVAALLVMVHLGEAEHKLRDIEWRSSLPDNVRVAADGSVRVRSASDDGLTLTLARWRRPGSRKTATP